METFSNLNDVKAFIDVHELNSKVKFVSQSSTKNFGGEGTELNTLLVFCYVVN